MWRTLGVNIRILFSAQQIQDTQNYHGHAIQPGGQAAGVWGYTCRELATMRCLRLNLGTCTCIFKLSNTHAHIHDTNFQLHMQTNKSTLKASTACLISLH